jgi:hypothetical protein
MIGVESDTAFSFQGMQRSFSSTDSLEFDRLSRGIEPALNMV